MPPHPLHIRDGACAVVERASSGQWGTNCRRPPTRRAVWRFHDGPERLLLCDLHAAELAGHDRLGMVEPTGG